MLSVEEALDNILDGVSRLDAEPVALPDVPGRIAAEDIAARLTQPPFDASAMDGYAMRFADASLGTTLRVIGEAPAGQPFEGKVGQGTAVRIFTGGAVPEGADHVVMQEHVKRDGDSITIEQQQMRARNIRAAGIDFMEGDGLVRDGDQLHEMHGSVLAAANVAQVWVTRRPKVCLFSNGDELVEPGTELSPGQIVNSNHYALSAMISSWGGEVRYLGCAADTETALKQHFEKASGADLIIPIGGASVGDYDFVKTAFSELGGAVEFEKVAVRPGKPTWYGMLGSARVIGLPGNPASAIVTCAIFVQPLVRRLAGAQGPQNARARSAVTLPANGSRESYMRAKATESDGGGLVVTPIDNQDSSLLSPFAEANVLLRREINAPEAEPGDFVEIVWLR